MAKKNLGDKSLLCPNPVTLVGADVEGKPNFMTAAYAGTVNAGPGMIALGINRKHHTLKGIIANRAFSVNLPGESLLSAADYMGMVSGADTDKSAFFQVFYGRPAGAPMIEECPLNMACRVLDVLDRGGRDLIIIGEVVESYCDEACLTGDAPDITKIKPVVYNNKRYVGLGADLGQAWEIGKGYKPEA